MPYPVAAARGRSFVPSGGKWYLLGGVPASFAAYQANGVASYAASKINLKNPGAYDLADGAAYPSWNTATGWSFVTASNQYLVTGITPVGQGAWTLIVQFANAASGTRYMMRCTSTNFTFGLAPYYTGGNHYYYGGAASALSVAGGVAAGVMAVAGLNCYLNGASEGAVSPSAVGDNTTPLLVGCNYNGTSRGNYYTGDILKMALWDSVLDAAAVAAVSVAMAAQ